MKGEETGVLGFVSVGFHVYLAKSCLRDTKPRALLDCPIQGLSKLCDKEKPSGIEAE
jgi:hypothetical protein